MLMFLRYFVFSMKQDSKITIIAYENKHKQTWDNFIDLSKNSTFLFKRDFMEYHQDRFVDESLLFYLNDALVAVFPANRNNTTIYSHQGLTYGGLIIGNNVRFSVYKLLFNCLMEHFKANGVTDVYIKPIPSLYGEQANDELQFLSQFYNSKVEHNIGSVIFQNDRKVISKSIIRNSNKALRNGITIKATDDFNFFWNNLLEPRLLSKFNKKPIHSLDEILRLKKLFPDHIQLIGAFLNDVMIAGTILFVNKNYLKSQYIAGNKEYNSLGGLDLLHLHIIENLDRHYFDFGTSSLDSSVNENEKLLAWKEQFGARTIIFSTYHFKL